MRNRTFGTVVTLSIAALATASVQAQPLKPFWALLQAAFDKTDEPEVLASF